MKRTVLICLLLRTTVMLAAGGKNPADFPIVVHVVFTRAVLVGGYQQIEAIIDGERVELTAFSAGMLALGDYSARISTKVHGPKTPNDYDVYKGYDFLMSDGKVRAYQLTAVGQSEFPAAPPPSPSPPSYTPPPSTPALPPPTP